MGIASFMEVICGLQKINSHKPSSTLFLVGFLVRLDTLHSISVDTICRSWHDVAFTKLVLVA